MALVGKLHVHPPIMELKPEKVAPMKLPTKPFPLRSLLGNLALMVFVRDTMRFDVRELHAP